MLDTKIPTFQELLDANLEHTLDHFRDWYDILFEALDEATQFANKRIPRDAREGGVGPDYYRELWVECAIAKLKGRQENGIQQIDTTAS